MYGEDRLERSIPGDMIWNLLSTIFSLPAAGQGYALECPRKRRFRIDSYVDDNRLYIKADLPGVEPKDVEIALDGNRLTVKGERKAEHEDKTADASIKSVHTDRLPGRLFCRRT